jgi:sugar lactone lactonase YvrE
MEMEVEGVYYFSRRKKVTRVIDDLKRPNGVLLSLDHKTLYITARTGFYSIDLNVKAPPPYRGK